MRKVARWALKSLRAGARALCTSVHSASSPTSGDNIILTFITLIVFWSFDPYQWSRSSSLVSILNLFINIIIKVKIPFTYIAFFQIFYFPNPPWGDPPDQRLRGEESFHWSQRVPDGYLHMQGGLTNFMVMIFGDDTFIEYIKTYFRTVNTILIITIVVIVLITIAIIVTNVLTITTVIFTRCARSLWSTTGWTLRRTSRRPTRSPPGSMRSTLRAGRSWILIVLGHSFQMMIIWPGFWQRQQSVGENDRSTGEGGADGGVKGEGAPHLHLHELMHSFMLKLMLATILYI